MTTRVLILNDGADTGGGSIKLKQAFDQFAPDWEVRAVRQSNNYINYPADIEWPKGTPITNEVTELFRRADLVHMVNFERLRKLLPGYDEKPKVLHIRGRGGTQPDPRITSAFARKVPVIVSTPNLLVAGTEWMPNIGDGEALARLRKSEFRSSTRRHPRRPILVHAPTIRRLKGTDDLIAALAPLAGRLDLELIEGQTIDECLRRKARGDLLFDQLGPLAGAYGSNAIEAWGLGMPVVNSEPSPSMRAWYDRVIGFVPFASVTAGTVAEVVGGLLDDPAALAEIRERGEETFHTFHEESAVVRRLIGVYGEALSG